MEQEEEEEQQVMEEKCRSTMRAVIMLRVPHEHPRTAAVAASSVLNAYHSTSSFTLFFLVLVLAK